MLEYIRASAQSFGVKVAFGVIILVFVFWGVGNFNDRDYSNVVAVVNGEPIVALEFEKAYHNAEEYLLRSNPGLTREALIRQHLGRQVLRDLIQATLLAQEARRAGITVSPQDLRVAVDHIKAFQDEQGKFDPEAYKRVLAAQRLSPAQYEKDLARDLLRDKMFALITASAWTDPDEARNRFNFIRERRVLDYLFVPAAPFREKVSVSDADLKSYYDANQRDFAIPQQVDVSYIEVSPAALVKENEISEADAKAWYDANVARYSRPEQVHARHIFAPLAPEADAAAHKAASERLQKARAGILAGKPFADVADVFNEKGATEKGGDLGWISRGETLPEFEEILFSIPVGQVSEPVRTPVGLHLVIVDEKRAAGTKPFAEVVDEVRKSIAFEKGSDRLHEVLDDLIEENILMKPLSEIASKYNLTSAETGLADKASLMGKLHIKAESADSLLSVPAGSPLDTALEAGDNYIIARVSKSQPAGTKAFEDVKAAIRERIVNERAVEQAMAEAENILTKIRQESLAKAREQYPEIKKTDPVERGGSIPGFAPDSEFIDIMFAAPLHGWSAKPVQASMNEGSEGALIGYVDKIVQPDSGEYDSVSQILSNAAKQERMTGLYDLFMEQLARNAKVEIVNQSLVDRITQ